jgi:DNA-binding NtrC family response regulator
MALNTLLLVEDEAISRLELAEFLTSQGYAVEAVQNGEEALKKLQHRSFDSLITDFRLGPGINGIDVIIEFERANPGRRKILITAYPSLVRMPDSLRVTHIPKPIALDELLRKLKTVT